MRDAWADTLVANRIAAVTDGCKSFLTLFLAVDGSQPQSVSVTATQQILCDGTAFERDEPIDRGLRLR